MPTFSRSWLITSAGGKATIKYQWLWMVPQAFLLGVWDSWALGCSKMWPREDKNHSYAFSLNLNERTTLGIENSIISLQKSAEFRHYITTDTGPFTWKKPSPMGWGEWGAPKNLLLGHVLKAKIWLLSPSMTRGWGQVSCYTRFINSSNITH